METSSSRLKSTRPTRFRWVVALLFFLIYTIAAADRANLGVALPFLRKEFAMSNTEAGALVSLFLIAYAIAQLPSAWLLSRFGVRKVFPVSMILTSMATALTGTVNSILALKLCRFGLGLAEGPTPISVTTTINNWFPPKEKGTASGIFLASVKFGPVIVPPICAAIIAMWGWKEIFLVFAIPGIFLSVVWYFLVTNTPGESRFTNEAECDYIADKVVAQAAEQACGVKPIPWLDKLIRVSEEPLLSTSKQLFKSWNIIGCALGYCCQIGISNVLLAWIPTYLITVKKLSIMNMGFVAAAPWVGAVAGNILGGMLSDRLLEKRRKPGMLISALATAGMMFGLINSPSDPVIYGILLFATGVLLSIGFSAYMAYPMALASKEKFPLASAIINMGGQLGGAAAPFITGVLLDSLGWDAVFGFMSAISLLTFLLLLSIREPLKVQQK